MTGKEANGVEEQCVTLNGCASAVATFPDLSLQRAPPFQFFLLLLTQTEKQKQKKKKKWERPANEATSALAQLCDTNPC